MRNSTTQQICYTKCSKNNNTSSNSISLSTNNKEKNLKNFNCISISKELEEEVHDLKEMLEMQEMINLEQEQRLKKNFEEKKNLMSEKNSCLIKISKMQEDTDNKVLIIKGLEEKIVELEMALIYEKKKKDEEFEKVKKLTRDNKNLQQTIEKKTRKINKLKSQLEDERSFYLQEKSRYYEEMKRRKNHSTEVQTDHVSVIVEDDTVSLKKNIDDRLRALYKHQLITTCLICEKYIRLQHYKNVLRCRLSKTIKEYKKAVCDIMLEFDQCRAEYAAVLEDRNCNKDLSENMTENMLKIVNRSNRLASDNAVLKQEFLHLNNRLCLIKAYHHSKYDESELNMNEINFNKINSDVSLNDNNKNNINNNNCNKVLLKKKKRIRRKNHVKRKIKKNNTNSNYKNCSSAPESTEHDSSDCYENDKKFKNSVNYKAGLKKCGNTSNITNNNNNNNNNNNKNIPVLSSNSFNENSEAGIIRTRNNRVNICPSFISFSSDNSVYISESFQCSKNEEIKKKVLKQNKLSERSDVSCKTIFKCNIEEETEPAFLPVTSCDEIKPYKKNNHVVTEITQFSNNFRDNLQEWLAKTPIIECSEWSKSVQGSEIIKTESAPELLMKSSLSSVHLYPK